jgi:hypothetical protein
MAKINMGFVIELPGRGIVVTKRLPITRDLTEAQFMSVVDQIDGAVLVVRSVVNFEFEGKAVKPTP